MFYAAFLLEFLPSQIPLMASCAVTLFQQDELYKYNPKQTKLVFIC